MAETDRYTIRTYTIPPVLMVAQGRLTDEQFKIVQEKAPEIFEAVRGEQKGETPVGALNAFYGAIEEVLGSVEATYKVAFACAEEGIGPAALNSFLRLVIKFMPPSVFARKCNDFYRRDNTVGQIVLESFDGEARRFVLQLNDVGGFHYASAGLCGVVSCMMKAMGHGGTRVVETLHPPPEPQRHDRYRLVVTW